MPLLSSGEFVYGSADNDTVRWTCRRIPSTYHTADLDDARRTMFRRANRWGGIWCVYPHPFYREEYAVALQGLLPGDAICSAGTKLHPEVLE